MECLVMSIRRYYRLNNMRVYITIQLGQPSEHSLYIWYLRFTHLKQKFLMIVQCIMRTFIVLIHLYLLLNRKLEQIMVVDFLFPTISKKKPDYLRFKHFKWKFPLFVQCIMRTFVVLIFLHSSPDRKLERIMVVFYFPQ